MLTGLYDKAVMGEKRKNKPRRRLHLRGLLIFCPTSGRTLVMGFHPLFRFDCRRRSGSLIRTLAPHQAKPGLLSGGVSSMSQDPPAKRVSPAGRKNWCLTRRSGCPRNPVSTGSIAIELSRVGRSGSHCGCRNSFSQHQKRAPQTAQRQPETAAEILCEVRKVQGT